jgi:bifunctional non-homologous end joining protein LigD
LNLQEYRDQNQKVKPGADILERWQKRVVARNLTGASGAMQYLADYGKGIGIKKVVMLARQAEIVGDIPMSEMFYAKAHELEFGQPATGSLFSRPTDVIVMTMSPRQEMHLNGIPDEMQPGMIVTAQPEDAVLSREFFVGSPDYYGQPKIDGQKVLAFVTSAQVAYQSRSMKLHPTPSVEMDKALMKTAFNIGPFILEGEVTYLDCDGGEHRTGAQAATYNIECGAGAVPPEMRFYVFDCLYWFQDGDLRGRAKATRTMKAETICIHIQNTRFDGIMAVYTARTGDEKQRLVNAQVTEGREGEVWFRTNTYYCPGKQNDEFFVRTKYLKELEANIIAVARPTAEGHFIGGFEIANDGGVSLGKIGTGYSREDQQEILERFQIGNVRVKIKCQGFTENGKVWHGRFIGWPE